MRQLRFKQVTFFLSVFFISSALLAYEIEHGDKLTIVKFFSADFANQGRIEEEMGRRNSCLIETQAFNLPPNGESEVEIIVKSSALWEAKADSHESVARLHLGVIEFTYENLFGEAIFIPQMIRSNAFGPPQLYRRGDDGQLFFLGGSLSETKQFVLPPIVLPRGSKKLRAAICQIAPTTTIHLHELQIRFRPVL